MISLIKQKKIDKLLCYNFLKIFIRVFLIITLTSIITFFYSAFNYLNDRQIGFIAYLKICTTFYLTILPYIIIIATIFSSTFLSHMLNRTLELYALQSLGVSFHRMLRTLFKPAFIIFAFAFINAHYLFPQATFTMISLGMEIIKKNPTAVITPNVFTKDIKGICLYAKEKINNSSYKDIVIYKNEKGNKLLALAEKATIENINGNSLRITLENGNNYSDVFDPTGGSTNSFHFSFEKESIFIDLNDIFLSLGIKKKDPFFKDSLTLHREIKEKKRIMENNINDLFKMEYEEEEEKEKKNNMLIHSLFGITSEKNNHDIIERKDLYPTAKNISAEEQNKNKELMQEICNKIRTEKKNFKKETISARENLMHRDALAFACLILFLLCFSLGFLLHRCSYLKLLLLSFFIGLCFFTSLIYMDIILGKYINIYIRYFGHILVLIPITVLAIFYANKNMSGHTDKFKNTIKKYKTKIKSKMKTLLIKLWEAL